MVALKAKSEKDNNSSILYVFLSILFSLIGVIFITVLIAMIPLSQKTIITDEDPSSLFSNIFYRNSYDTFLPPTPKTICDFCPLFPFYIFLIFAIISLAISNWGFSNRIDDNKANKVLIFFLWILYSLPIIVGIIKFVKLVNGGHNFSFIYDWDPLNPTEIVLPLAIFPMFFTIFVNISHLRGTYKYWSNVKFVFYIILQILLPCILVAHYILYLFMDMIFLKHINHFYIFIAIFLLVFISWLPNEIKAKGYREVDRIERTLEKEKSTRAK